MQRKGSPPFGERQGRVGRGGRGWGGTVWWTDIVTPASGDSCICRVVFPLPALPAETNIATFCLVPASVNYFNASITSLQWCLFLPFRNMYWFPIGVKWQEHSSLCWLCCFLRCAPMNLAGHGDKRVKVLIVCFSPLCNQHKFWLVILSVVHFATVEHTSSIGNIYLLLYLYIFI